MISVLQPQHHAALTASGLVDDPAAWTAGPTGQDDHRWCRRKDDAITAVVRLQPRLRLRLRHAGDLTFSGTPDAELLATATRFADDWTALDRLNLLLPAGHPAIPVAEQLGFQREVIRRERLVTGDEVLLGRLRPGFVPRPPGPPPPWPARHRATPRWGWRSLTEADLPDVLALSVEPTTVWGTLQVPSMNLPFCAKRHHDTPPGDAMFLLIDEATGQVAGIGGLHRVGLPDVRMLGMCVDLAWQGCGGGRFIMERLLAAAKVDGARRVELAVWEDNHRAAALYRSFGFEVEGVTRCDGIRAGGHASSMEMARTV